MIKVNVCKSLFEEFMATGFRGDAFEIIEGVPSGSKLINLSINLSTDTAEIYFMEPDGSREDLKETGLKIERLKIKERTEAKELKEQIKETVYRLDSLINELLDKDTLFKEQK